MPTVDYLPIATQGAAPNVDTQANFIGSGYQQNGFSAGLAQSKQANKAWRQASMIAAAVANFIANTLHQNVPDDGNLANLITQLTSAITAIAAGAASPQVIVVAFTASPTFTCPAILNVNFEITLTGNVVGSTLANPLPGQLITFIIHQDATGGRTFVWPANVPGANIDPGISATSVQMFIVDSSNVLHPVGAMTVS